jgi:fructose-1-phosphate kinase PfkB-like protein
MTIRGEKAEATSITRKNPKLKSQLNNKLSRLNKQAFMASPQERDQCSSTPRKRMR